VRVPYLGVGQCGYQSLRVWGSVSLDLCECGTERVLPYVVMDNVGMDQCECSAGCGCGPV
jgi:hypothetical protein